MMYDIRQLKKQLQPGDVFVVHGKHLISRIIRIVTDSHWNHATMYIGKGKYIEANNEGVEIKSLEEYKDKNFEIYRHTRTSRKQQKKIVDHAKKEVGKVYDLFQIIQLFFYFLFGIRGNAREIGTKNKYICSELVAESYNVAGLPIYKDYHATQISPGDFQQSEYFRLCVQKKNIALLK